VSIFSGEGIVTLLFVRKSVSDPKACATACPKTFQIDTCASRDVAGAFFPRRFKELRAIDQEITSYCFAVRGWQSRSH
jgi:hypothetical protein